MHMFLLESGEDVGCYLAMLQIMHRSPKYGMDLQWYQVYNIPPVVELLYVNIC